MSIDFSWIVEQVEEGTIHLKLARNRRQMIHWNLGGGRFCKTSKHMVGSHAEPTLGKGGALASIFLLFFDFKGRALIAEGEPRILKRSLRSFFVSIEFLT